MKNLGQLARELDQSDRKLSQVHASSGQTESQAPTSFKLAMTCDSGQGLKDDKSGKKSLSCGELSCPRHQSLADRV